MKNSRQLLGFSAVTLRHVVMDTPALLDRIDSTAFILDFVKLNHIHTHSHRLNDKFHLHHLLDVLLRGLFLPLWSSPILMRADTSAPYVLHFCQDRNFTSGHRLIPRIDSGQPSGLGGAAARHRIMNAPALLNRIDCAINVRRTITLLVKHEHVSTCFHGLNDKIQLHHLLTRSLRGLFPPSGSSGMPVDPKKIAATYGSRR
jgi:hypothetical protein